MHVSLFVPGLSWFDGHDAAEAAKDLSLPGLETLLGRGDRTAAPLRLSQGLGAPFGLDALQIAAQAAADDGLETTGRTWLLADPVTLRIDRDRALLADVGVMRLDAAEVAALLQALNQHFASDDLCFHAPTPTRWYLSLPTTYQVRCHALPDVVGENVDHFLPQGADRLVLSRLLNEVQMLLYAHPVNEARTARGEPEVNSLWLWGEGGQAPQPCASQLFADHAVSQLLAQMSGSDCQPTPWSFAALQSTWQPGRPAWVQLDRLLGPAQYRDVWGWREQLLQLEQDWFQPLCAALRQGRVTTLTLLTCGEQGLRVRVRRADLWKCWRRPMPLARLY